MSKIRPNVSGGAGGERFDRRAHVKDMARTARRTQDADMADEGMGDFYDPDDPECITCGLPTGIAGVDECAECVWITR